MKSTLLLITLCFNAVVALYSTVPTFFWSDDEGAFSHSGATLTEELNQIQAREVISALFDHSELSQVASTGSLGREIPSLVLSRLPGRPSSLYFSPTLRWVPLC